jgi:trimeric autotransporter adhesin
MKVQLKIWFIALLLAVFSTGCGCGGGGGTQADLVSIEVTPTNTSIELGIHQQFTAIGTFTDNTTQDITTSVDWNSSDPSIATISDTAGSKGLATSVAAGSTSIIATSGSISGSTSLTVTAVTLVSITVTPARMFAGFNTTVQYKAVGTFSDNTAEDITTTVIWSSSDPSIATISNEPGSKGLATTDSRIGSTTITATLGNISGSAVLIDP